MPWVLLVRWILRLAAGLFFWRVVTARRRAYVNGTAASARPPRRAPGRVDPRAAARAFREGLSLGWRVATLATLVIFAGVLISAGTASALLSPRWLGGVLLGFAAVTIVAVFVEGRALFHALADRRRRRHDDDLRRLT